MQSFQIKKITIGISLLLILFSCNKEELKNIMQSGIGFSNKLVYNMANIQVADALDGTIFKDGEIRVERINPAVSLYTMSGDDTLVYDNQLIAIAVSPKDTPTINKPVKILLRISHKSSEYLPAIVSLTILSNVPESRKVRLLKVNGLPSGVKTDFNDSIQSCSPSTRNIKLQVPFSNLDSIKITFQPNTEFFKAGKKMCGSVKARLIAFDYADSNVIRFFPGSLIYKSITDVSGRKLDKGGIFSTFGFFKLHVTVNGEDIDSFYPAASVTMGMADRKRTITTGSPNVKDGILSDNQEVLIYNSINDGQIWKTDTLATVRNKQVSFPISKTDWFQVGDPSCDDLYDYLSKKLKNETPVDPICPPCGIAKLKFVLRDEVNSTYYTKISLASNNRMIVSEPMMHYKNDNIIDLLQYMGNIDAGVKINFTVYDKEPWAAGSKELFRKEDITICNSMPTQLDMTNVAFPQQASIEMNLVIRCLTLQAIIHPTVTILARKTDGINSIGDWNFLGNITNGVGATYNILECGKRYEFCINNNKELTTNKVKILQDGVVTSGIKIPDNCTSAFSVTFTRQDLTLNQEVSMIPLGNKRYKLDLTDWAPSDSMCEKYKKYLIR